MRRTFITRTLTRAHKRVYTNSFEILVFFFRYIFYKDCLVYISIVFMFEMTRLFNGIVVYLNVSEFLRQIFALFHSGILLCLIQSGYFPNYYHESLFQIFFLFLQVPYKDNDRPSSFTLLSSNWNCLHAVETTSHHFTCCWSFLF